MIPKEEVTRKSQSLPRFPPTETFRQRNSNSEKELRIVVMGGTGVGKTGESFGFFYNTIIIIIIITVVFHKYFS